MATYTKEQIDITAQLIIEATDSLFSGVMNKKSGLSLFNDLLLESVLCLDLLQE